MIGFDEGEVNKTSELEILVKIATRDDYNNIMLWHYKTIVLQIPLSTLLLKHFKMMVSIMKANVLLQYQVVGM